MATFDSHVSHVHGSNMPHLGKDHHSHVTETAVDADLAGMDTHNTSVLEMNRTRRLPRPGHTHSHSPRDNSPTGSVRSSFSARRRVSRATSYGVSYKRQYSSEISKELVAQAEGEFFALTELMANMSRRSGSLREVWNKIISERESCYTEMDKMYERLEEFSEIIERKEREQSHNHHEHEERLQEVARVRLQLKAALSSTSEFKTKLAERDTECRNLVHEISHVKDSLSHSRKEHEETKKTYEHTRQTLITTESARSDLEEKYGKLRGDRDGLDLKYTELLSRYEELNSKFDTTHKELTQYKHISSNLKKEKHEWLHREGEMDEKLRKWEHKNDELRRKNKDLEERLEKKQLEVKEFQETVTKAEQRVTKAKHEKTELEQHIERLKRDVVKEHSRWEEAEDRCGKWKLKVEHSEREMVSAREDMSRIEMAQTELRETISKKSEEIRQLLLEKKRLEEDGHQHAGRADETHRQLLIAQESLSHTETTLQKTQDEVHSKLETIEKLELVHGAAKLRAKDLEIEVQNHGSLAASLRLEVETLAAECGSLKQKCRDWEGRYEEVCESVTEYEDGSSGFEFELASMRTMLREAREQKERAIGARNSADRERDEAISKYEEKCREMERLEERMSQHMHEQGARRSSGSRTVVRHFSKSGHGHMTNGGSSEFGGTIETL
ncbi:hypothetical protein C8035_v003353 [Colletotrichum spinosum]|uniref:Uncharacterized protein n=1 Tax=Colletotrichum spinosum TaxID=1347390 RepID=A0A4V3HTF8_9PEZI|nr:hypothetical protein C8035_v003353 [Colletotrichum spinosum]